MRELTDGYMCELLEGLDEESKEGMRCFSSQTSTSTHPLIPKPEPCHQHMVRSENTRGHTESSHCIEI